VLGLSPERLAEDEQKLRDGWIGYNRTLIETTTEAPGRGRRDEHKAGDGKYFLN